jgi:small subunit ribosomal protein S6
MVAQIQGKDVTVMAEEATTLYEAMYILEVKLTEEEQAQASEQLKEATIAAGGEFVSDELFGRRRLAFAIEGHVEGIYRIMYFRGDGVIAEEVKHQYVLIEPIVRGMVVVANPKAIFSAAPPKKAEEAAPAPVVEAPAPVEATPAEEELTPAAVETVAEEAVVEAPAVEEAPVEEAPAPVEEAVVEAPAAEEAPVEEGAEAAAPAEEA